MAPVRDPALRASVPALVREPLLWAAMAAFVGAAVGLLGTLWQARLVVSFDLDPTADLWAAALQACGQTLAALSLLGVPSLLGTSRPASDHRARATWATSRLPSAVGASLIAVLAVASAASVFYLWYLNTPEMARNLGPPPAPASVLFVGSRAPPARDRAPVCPGGPLAPPPGTRGTAVGTVRAGHAVRLRVVVPVSRPLAPPENLPGLVALGFFGWGVSAPEAPAWVLLGAIFMREARQRALGQAERRQEAENLATARRLYEVGLGRGDGSVVDESVSESFHDLKSGARGRSGMGRLIADLRASYPDLSVSILRQEAEHDLVRTRVLLSGTDRGRGVMWYPPTGRRVSFEAEFSDRFRDGVVVEHAGEADTEALIEQLGHHREGHPDTEPSGGA